MTAPDPSSAGTAHRGAHLRGLPGLLPARDLAGAAEAAGGRADTRAVLDAFAAIQMLDVCFPTTDRRTLILTRHTELSTDQKLLVRQLNLDLPPQPPPRITATQPVRRAPAHAL